MICQVIRASAFGSSSTRRASRASIPRGTPRSIAGPVADRARGFPPAFAIDSRPAAIDRRDRARPGRARPRVVAPSSIFPSPFSWESPTNRARRETLTTTREASLSREHSVAAKKSRRRTNLSTVARARRSHPRAQRSPRPSLPDPSSAAPPRTPRAAHVRRRPRRSLRFFAHSFRGRTRQPPSQCRSRPSGSTTSARARPWSTRASSPSSAPSSRRSKTPAWCALASLAPSRGSRDEPTATRRETRGGSRPAPRS
jgi:hypothetical protein